MTTNLFARLRNISLIVLLFCLSTGLLSAEQFGFFTYRLIPAGIEITGYPTSEVGAVVIPAEIDGLPVISIGSKAFSGCRGLTSVTIPASVTSINIWTFNECSELASITFANPSSLTSIGKGAFADCSGLTSIPLPDGLTSIGEDAFEYCSGLTEFVIPTTVTTIGENAFAGCDGLTSITVPARVTSIGTGAFDCAGLTAILVELGNSHYASDGGILVNADKAELIRYPAGRKEPYTIRPNITCISEAAFFRSGWLTGITIPTNVISIGLYAFAGCSRLPSIVVAPEHPQYSSVDGMLFDAAKTTLIQYPAGKPGPFTLPATVTSIGGGAFAYCLDLTSIVIPERVTSIEIKAFYGCSALSGITVPESVTTIGRSAFGECTGLTGITLPSGITTIREDTFLGCSGLTSIIIPPNVTSIENYAFEDCTGLTSVTIPDSVTSIGDEAFYWCSGLTSVTIPASVTNIGSRAFSGCRGLTSAVFLGAAPTMGWVVFEQVAPGFRVYYFDGKAGFTSPTWTTPGGANYPAVNMGAESPTKPWLIANGFHFNTDLQADPNGDGVNLLLAYALELNPNDNLAGSMPKPVLEAGTMSLTFHAASPGITYTVETSVDLKTWTTNGVSLSELAPDHTRTATVDRLSPVRFLRLVVSVPSTLL